MRDENKMGNGTHNVISGCFKCQFTPSCDHWWWKKYSWYCVNALLCRTPCLGWRGGSPTGWRWEVGKTLWSIRFLCSFRPWFSAPWCVWAFKTWKLENLFWTYFFIQTSKLFFVLLFFYKGGGDGSSLAAILRHRNETEFCTCLCTNEDMSRMSLALSSQNTICSQSPQWVDITQIL